jgi:hypothetical protein
MTWDDIKSFRRMMRPQFQRRAAIAQLGRPGGRSTAEERGRAK